MPEIIDITPPSQEEILLAGLKQAVEEHEKGLFIINQKRYGEMQRALRIISKIVLENDPDAKIKCDLVESFKDVGQIVIESTDIGAQGYEMDEFREVISFATTFEVYPIKGNRVRCGMTFSGIMHKKT